MPLTPGTKLGQYEVVESIGAGGMGEVYRARDTKLGRDVAIKVLPEEFARDKAFWLDRLSGDEGDEEDAAALPNLEEAEHVVEALLGAHLARTDEGVDVQK